MEHIKIYVATIIGFVGAFIANPIWRVVDRYRNAVYVYGD